MISCFDGDNYFLSNFYPSSVIYGPNDDIFPSNENAYQAAKAMLVSQNYSEFLTCRASESKKLGRKINFIRNGKDYFPKWEEIKIKVMRKILYNKFHNTELREKLFATGDQELVEGNWHGDVFWGKIPQKHDWVGENHLGKLLMELRENLRKENV